MSKRDGIAEVRRRRNYLTWMAWLVVGTVAGVATLAVFQKRSAEKDQAHLDEIRKIISEAWGRSGGYPLGAISEGWARSGPYPTEALLRVGPNYKLLLK